jgi:hypothetical protein
MHACRCICFDGLKSFSFQIKFKSSKLSKSPKTTPFFPLLSPTWSHLSLSPARPFLFFSFPCSPKHSRGPTQPAQNSFPSAHLSSSLSLTHRQTGPTRRDRLPPPVAPNLPPLAMVAPPHRLPGVVPSHAPLPLPHRVAVIEPTPPTRPLTF